MIYKYTGIPTTGCLSAGLAVCDVNSVGERDTGLEARARGRDYCNLGGRVETCVYNNSSHNIGNKDIST